MNEKEQYGESMELDSDPESIDVLDIYLFGDNYVSAVREVIVGE